MSTAGSVCTITGGGVAVEEKKACMCMYRISCVYQSLYTLTGIFGHLKSDEALPCSTK